MNKHKKPVILNPLQMCKSNPLEGLLEIRVETSWVLGRGRGNEAYEKVKQRIEDYAQKIDAAVACIEEQRIRDDFISTAWARVYYYK